MIEHIPYPGHKQKLVVLSPAEEAAVFAATRNFKHRTILMTICAAGLRVSELTSLRLTESTASGRFICVRQGKGQKDRQVMLSPKLLELLRIYWKSYRPALWLFPGVKYHPKFPPSYHLKLLPRLKPVRLGKCEEGHPGLAHFV
jgi:integrase/recombinase XerD